jgi:thiamine biosynthesis lipoprotein
MRRAWVEHVMGMPASVLLRGESLDGAEDVVASASAELHRIDATFSTYRDDSEISRLRAGAMRRADVSSDVAEVLDLCERARQDTGGWFDIDLPGGLDPSGLVTGWAIERALAVLRTLPDVDVCLNVGGDVAVHVAAGRPAFVAGIEDPHDRSRLAATVPLTDGGLATSGTAARGLHIVDPHTGRPVSDVASVSVLGPSPMWADVYATAAFARADRVGWLAGLPSYEGLVVRCDGAVETTAGWPARVTA